MMRIRQLFPVLFIVVILLLAIQAIRYQLRDSSLQQVWQSIQLIPLDHLVGALVLTILGYLAVTGYDLLGFHYIRRSLEPIKIIFTSFLSYAIGNTIGFTIFSGAAIRYRFYTPWGISAINVAKLVAFTHLSFWLGMLTLGGIVFLIDPLTIPQILHLSFSSLHPIGILFLIVAGVYFILSARLKHPLRIRQEEFTLPSVGLSLGLICLSAIDWMLAAGVLYLLMPAPMPISYFSFFGVYVLAMTAGIFSTVPGGLGVFETVILLLRPETVPAPQVLAALLAFRAIYFFLPLLVATGLMIGYEVRHHKSN